MSIQFSDYDLLNSRVIPLPINITLTGPYTLANPIGVFTDGTRLIWRLIQDATGGRTVTLDTKFRLPSSASAILAFSTTSGDADVLAAMYNLADDKWDIVSFVPGY